MKAAVYHGPREVRVEEVHPPSSNDDGLLLRVLACDMCGTDLKMFVRGHPLVRPPITIGHEYCGEVVEAGRGSKFRKGDRVVASNSVPCLKCEMCKRGSFTICTSIKENLVGFSLPGAYAGLVEVPSAIAKRNTYRFERAKPEEIACAEPLASVIHALDRTTVEAGQEAAVIGAGALGLMFLQLLKAKGLKVLVANRSGGRLDLAEKLGADEVMLADESIVEKVRRSTRGLGADLVVEAVGRKETWESAFKAARDGGTALMFGGCAASTTVSFDAGKLHYGETNVVGSFHHEPTAFKRAVEAIETGRVDVSRMISKKMKLDDIGDAFQILERREAMKIAIVP